MAELTKEQKRIIRLIEKEATAAGIDPDFAVAIANLESTFQHIPATDKTSTAFGPFQVNKATAQANGVDYNEMKSNPDLAVKTGVMNLARHAKNPLFEGNPMRIVAAHRFGENSEYAKTGDETKIDKVLANYLADTMEHFPEQAFPQTVYTKPTEKAAGQEMDMGTMPLGSTEPLPTDGETMDMGSQPLVTYSPYEADKSDRYLGAAEGAGAGAFIGAVKVPAISLYKKAYDYLHRAPQVQDVNAILEAANKVGQADIDTTGMTSGEKYALRTGYGEGKGTVKNVVDRQKLASPSGKIAKRVYERQKAVDSLSQADEIAANAQKAKAIADYDAWVSSQNAAGRGPDRVTKALGAVAGSSPIKYGLAGTGIGYNVEDAAQKFRNDDYLGGLASTGAALASGATLIPKYAARANPAAVGLTTASQAYGDVKAGKPQEAAETTLSGLTALAPRIFGPVGAALFSSGLNKNEDEELARYRSMKPPHLRP
jgi:hypothetical protein